MQKLFKHLRRKTCRDDHPPRSGTRKRFWMRCGERWGLCHSQSKPCVHEVERYCCKGHFPQKRPLPMAVKSIQLEKGLQRIQKKSILSCIPYESVWDVTDGTKTCWASEGREKARRWRSIPTTETQDTQVIVHSFVRLGVEIIGIHSKVTGNQRMRPKQGMRANQRMRPNQGMKLMRLLTERNTLHEVETKELVMYRYFSYNRDSVMNW